MWPPSMSPQCVSVRHTISGSCSWIRLLNSSVLHGAEAQFTFQLTTITESLLRLIPTFFPRVSASRERLPHLLEVIGNRPPAEAEAAYYRQAEHTALAA